MIRYESSDPAAKQDTLHPDAIFREELLLARHFSDSAERSSAIDDCPVSGSARYEIFFEKWGRAYAFCPRTWSLALASLPSSESLRDYFLDSDLSRLRATEAYQAQLSVKRMPVWVHLVEWVEGRRQRYLSKGAVDVIDWGSRSVGWTRLLGQAAWVDHFGVVDTLPPVVSADHGEHAELICLFDVIQRSATPEQLLREVVARLKPGGLLLTSCRSGAGFDVLTLGSESNSIFPFDHVCLPSPEGMRQLLDKVGLELLELTTPGMLDVELVRDAIHDLPRNRYFQRYLLEFGNPEMDVRLQLFLQQNNLSSHLRVVARKPLDTA